MLFIPALSQFATAQGHVVNNPDPAAQKKFIAEIRHRYATPSRWFTHRTATVNVCSLPGTARYTCKIVDRAVVVLSNGEKVLVVLHSAHKNTDIGDLGVAITAKGKVYLHRGHVCGGVLSLQTPDGKTARTLAEFFTWMQDDVDNKKWEMATALK